MPKLGMQPIRTTALINAVIDEIGASGSLDVTVGQIARRAGMSSALAHHYFGSKTNMLVAAMRHILTQFGSEVRANIAGEADPRRRLEIIIRTCFSASNMRPETVSAWLNFYVYARKSGEVSRLLNVYHRRLRSNLLHDLRRLAPEHAASTAEGIAALIDGAYIRWALCEGCEKPADPGTLVLDYLDLKLANCRDRAVRPRPWLQETGT